MAMVVRVLFLCAVSCTVLVQGFRPSPHRIWSPQLTTERGVLRMSAEESDRDKGYGPVGSLIRQGPVPFVIRLVKPDTYEAAVQKYMAREGCDRTTAQGNMDAYFQDPNGWTLAKLKGSDVDYGTVNTSPDQLLLTAVWAAGISWLFYRIYAVQVLGQ